jgi:type II secretory pathway component PulF
MYSFSQTTALLAGSSAFAALIWWVVPAAGLIGGIGYVVWISKFKRKFESETSRSVGQFQRFQESFRAEETPMVNNEIEDQLDIHVDRDKL